MSSFPNNHYWAYAFLIPWALAHKERGSKNFALGEKTLKKGHDYRKHQNGSHDQNEKKMFGKHGKV